jgi:hypothetical protein
MNVTDFPSPHPGQKSKPAFFKGHMVKWLSVSAKASNKRPVIHKSASKGMRRGMLKDNVSEE